MKVVPDHHSGDREHVAQDPIYELDRVKAERTLWARRVALLKSNQIDPDMLDERAVRPDPESG